MGLLLITKRKTQRLLRLDESIDMGVKIVSSIYIIGGHTAYYFCLHPEMPLPISGST